MKNIILYIASNENDFYYFTVFSTLERNKCIDIMLRSEISGLKIL